MSSKTIFELREGWFFALFLAQSVFVSLGILMEDFNVLLRDRSLEEPTQHALELRARRNGVAEEIGVFVPMPQPNDGWVRATVASISAALRGKALPLAHPYPEDAFIPETAEVYTGDGIGPLTDESISHLRNGTLLVLVGGGRPFVWPAVVGGPRFSPPRAPLVDGRPIELEPVSNSPRVFKVHNFVSEDECDMIIKHVPHLPNSHGLQRSTTGGKRSAGGMSTISTRTSDNAFDVDSMMAHRLIRRSFRLLGMKFNAQVADGLQLVRYQIGQAYNTHNDAFKSGRSEKFNYDATRGGADRFATVFMYCSTPEEGGQTVFPFARNYSKEGFPNTWSTRKAELEALVKESGMTQPWESDMVQKCHSKLAVRPQMGQAVIFYSQHVDGRIDDAALHGGCPVLKGVKWSANLWVWNGPRDGTFHYPGKSKDVSLRNDYSGRAKVFKNNQFLGVLQPGEEAPFFMHVGQTWEVKAQETGKVLARWKIQGLKRNLFVVPPAPRDEL